MTNPGRPRRAPRRSSRPHARRRSHPRAAVALVLAACVAGGCSFGTSNESREDISSASEGDAAHVATTVAAPEEGDDVPEDDDGGGALLLIMDASGSMNGEGPDGEPLIEGAKEALHGVVDGLPDGVHVGLRVYGHRYPNTDRANGCADTELISPVAPLDRDALNATIDGYEAVGFTPIGLSLQQALGDLPPEGPRSIVLVSDGEDTCAPPDPCQVAGEVRAEGVDLVIHTVGFALPDEASRTQLECIAEAGGGEFHDAATADELAETLAGVSEQEAARYEASGVALAGAPIPRDAPTGQVDTAHVDTMAGNEVRFYRFEIEPGSTVRGEMIMTGDTPGSLFCPTVWLTDEADEDYANGPFGGGDQTETYIKHTDDVEIEADEVWIKVDTESCRPGDPVDGTYSVELQLTVVD
jgi:von Willebrand factor type A domain